MLHTSSCSQNISYKMIPYIYMFLGWTIAFLDNSCAPKLSLNMVIGSKCRNSISATNSFKYIAFFAASVSIPLLLLIGPLSFAFATSSRSVFLHMSIRTRCMIVCLTCICLNQHQHIPQLLIPLSYNKYYSLF